MINYQDYSNYYSNDYTENSTEAEEIETIVDELDLPEQPVEDKSDDLPLGKVNIHEVYIREDAGKYFNPITTVKKDAELMILEDSNPEWYKVMTATGIEGYIMREFVDVK